MAEQVVSGGLNEAAAISSNKNIKQDNQVLIQDAQQKQKQKPKQQNNSNSNSSKNNELSSSPAETNNNNLADCVGSAIRASGKGERSAGDNNQNGHHRHRRHSNSERTAAASKAAKSAQNFAGQHHSSSSSSSSSSSKLSLENAAGKATSQSAVKSDELCGQPLDDGAVAPGVISVAGRTESPNSSIGVGRFSSTAPAADAAQATFSEQASSGEISGEASQTCSSNIALIPIAPDCCTNRVASKIVEPINSSNNNNSNSNIEQGQLIKTTSANNQKITANNKTSDNNSYFLKETSNQKQRDSTTQNENNNNNNSYQIVDSHQLLQNDSCKQWSLTSSGDQQFCKRRKLSYLQSLLLRKWPCLAISILIMSSLLFGIFLSALTVYLLHGASECSNFVRAAVESSPGLSPAINQVSPREHLRYSEVANLDPLSSLTSSLTAIGEQLSAGNQQHRASSLDLAGLANNETTAAARFQRLPSSLWPIHYDLFVQPYIAEPFNFSGKVSIRIRCTEATDNITLHSLDLELKETTLSLQLAPQTNSAIASRLSLNSAASQQQQQQLRRDRRKSAANLPKVKGLSADKQLQYSIIHLDSPLEVGQEYVLGIDFTGWLNDDLAGFYKIKYERQNSNETTWVAATQFQATDARRAFPCFDEPLYKATFSIQIKHWKNMTALSNMPIIDQRDSPDGLWITDTFSKSQRMSTYLVAYAVTNFESRSEGNISVWTRPGFTHTANYALKIAGKLMRYYEDFFGIGYPLPKMDMIALPDFNAGAMENWGLITYRETAMLYDEESSSLINKQRVAVVVAHELAHQWFGNLVTPKWWDDLWLNEGFASYVEYIGVDHVEPEWKMIDQFQIDELQHVLKTDGLSSSHQISIPVNNPDEISEIFDHISYAKGASIIRMMNHFLTEPVFKQGLRGYLNALKYGNAEQSDLWTHLTEAAQRSSSNNNSTTFGKQSTTAVDVEKVMNCWTLQTGFPVVTLTRQYGGAKTAQLNQARFLTFNPGKDSNSASSTSTAMATNQTWEIPITLAWKSEKNWSPKTRIWMHQNQTEPVQLNSSLVPNSDDDWMVLNINQVGYYRVNYDLRNWKLLINQLSTDHKQIPTTTRAQILDDIFELARSGAIDYRLAMEATRYLRGERDYLPMESISMSLSYIDDMLQRTPLYGDWKDYIADLIAPYYARYKDTDWTIRANQNLANKTDNSNDILEHYNQVNAIFWACQVDEHCVRKAQSIFKEWRQSGKNLINPALRYTIYCTAIENGNKDDWYFLWKVYEKEQNASERDRLMRALGCTREIWLLSTYLELAFSKNKSSIRRQDGSFVFRVIAKNNYGRDIAFNFMRERWSIIKEFYGKSSFSLGTLIRAFSLSMNTQVELNQLTSFFETVKNDTGTGKRSFQIAIEEVESNVLWRNRSYKIIEEWLHEFLGKATSVKATLAS